MNYPPLIDYHEAVQDLRAAFLDAEIQNGRLELTPLGLPLALSGNFALTYMVHAKGKKLAIRCFHRAVPDIQKRYSQISSTLQSLASRYFVKFQFLQDEIFVRGIRYPIIKMDWVEGETLSVYLRRSFQKKHDLLHLRQSFRDLAAFLEEKGIAHGDLQNENIIVANNEPRLIDYDGMFVGGMREGDGSEVGDKHFQHPKRTSKHFGPKMDRFSFLVVEISLNALICDPSLHGKYSSGGQTIIFKASDYSDPSTSEVFFQLHKIPSLKDDVAKLTAICTAPFESIPTLSDFISGKNIPAGAVALKGPGKALQSKPVAVAAHQQFTRRVPKNISPAGSGMPQVVTPPSSTTPPSPPGTVTQLPTEGLPVGKIAALVVAGLLAWWLFGKTGSLFGGSSPISFTTAVVAQSVENNQPVGVTNSFASAPASPVFFASYVNARTGDDISISVWNDNAQVVTCKDVTAPGPNGNVWCSLNTSPLSAGSYSFHLAVNGQQIGTYPFTVGSSPLQPAPTAPSPSFDCSAAVKWSERQVCATPSLIPQDLQMATLYKGLLDGASEPDREALRTAQRQWMMQRDACEQAGDQAGCLTAVYADRIAALNGGLSSAETLKAPETASSVTPASPTQTNDSDSAVVTCTFVSSGEELQLSRSQCRERMGLIISEKEKGSP